MENRPNLNATGTQDSDIMKPLEQKERFRSRNDMMTRRLKNRERQRRYRARKRLEADMEKSSVTNQSSIPQGELEINGNHNNYITRVYCKRNWKKDARRAHTCKSLQEASAAVISGVTLNSESQTHSLVPEVAIQPLIERKSHSENSLSMPGETKTSLGRRDWKAEARRKKN